MNLIMRWTVLFAALMLIMQSSRALTIGSKGRVSGPSIHTTYFLTPNNAPTPVQAKAYAGYFANGNCQYNAIYDLGNEIVKTGDFIDIDAFLVKSIIGINYNCMSIYYTYKQLVI